MQVSSAHSMKLALDSAYAEGTVCKHAPVIRLITSPELKYVITDLVDVFMDTVNRGSPLGFMPPITRDESLQYWVSLLPELASGARKLIVVYYDRRVAGSGQLALSQRTNSPHRAEIQRLFVDRRFRGEGLGTFLVHGLHNLARENGRTLISLSTRYDERPHHFYRALGYKDAGVIPGWTIGPNGERYSHVTMYQELAPEITSRTSTSRVAGPIAGPLSTR